jgi:hypothetical protein
MGPNGLTLAFGDEVVISIAGHVSRAVPSRSGAPSTKSRHQRDEKRKEEAERREQAAVAMQSAAVVQ